MDHELDQFVATATILTDTMAMEISDAAVEATWTGVVSDGTLMLTSTEVAHRRMKLLT